MLLDFRETIRSSKPIKYTLIGLICVPFALVGIGSYFAGGSAQPVATVNGTAIDAQTLDRAYRVQRQRFAQVFGGSIPSGLDDEALLRRQALDELVTQRVLADEVAEMRFAVGDETLGRAIRGAPEFQVDGRFDRDRYTQLVTSAGGVAAFEAQQRDRTALQQFQAGVVETAFTLPDEAGRLDALARQTRTIDGVRLDLDAAKAAIEVSDEDIQARFDDSGDDYRFPPRVKIAYIELSADTVAGTLDVTEDDARDWYESNKARFVTPERREASHILLAVDDAGDADEIAAAVAEAEALAARLDAGESFEELAREASDDTGSAGSGGSLGEITPGLMVEPFEEAVFALEGEGSLSEPVVTEFGVHLIRLDAVVPEAGRGFDEVAEEALASARAAAADGEFNDLREALAESAFDEPESLDAAATATGLPVQQSDWLDAETDSGPLLSNPALRAAMFSDDVLLDGNNSELVEVGPRRLVVLRVTEDEGERPKTLDDVRDEVGEALRTERAEALLDERAAEIVSALARGEAPEAIAADVDFGVDVDLGADGGADGGVDADDAVTALSGEVLARDATMFDPATVAALFAAPAPAADGPSTDASTGTSTLGDGDRLAWRIVAVERPESEPVEVADGAQDDELGADGAIASPPALPSGADPRLGGVEFSALLQSLRDRADVELEDDLNPQPADG